MKVNYESMDDGFLEISCEPDDTTVKELLEIMIKYMEAYTEDEK